jgi:hypothetical protein
VNPVKVSFASGRRESDLRATRRFWNLFDALPDGIQQLAVKTTSFGVAPHHPSLHFR